MTLLFISLIFILGLMVGVGTTFIGMGGGVLIVPILPLIYPLGMREIVATTLLVVFLVAVINTLGFVKRRLVQWRESLTLGMGSMVGAYAAARMTRVIPEKWLLWIFLTVLVGLTYKAGGDAYRSRKGKNRAEESETKKFSLPKLLIIALVGGVIIGLTGVGAGILFSSVLLSFRIVENSEVVPTSNAAVMLTSAAGLLGYVGEIHWPAVGAIRLDVGLILFLGAWLSATFGRQYQHLMPREWRGGILTLILLLASGKIAFMAMSL